MCLITRRRSTCHLGRAVAIAILSCIVPALARAAEPASPRAEVEAATPTLSFVATRADGTFVGDVRVTMDGQVLADTLDGRFFAVEPGEHLFRFEHGSAAPVEEIVTVRSGEKGHIVAVRFTDAVVPVKAPAKQKGASGPPPATWVLGGIGVAGVATFAALGIAGLEQRSALERDCYGVCDQSRIDAIHRKFVAADIALGIGALSLGAATVLLLLHGGESKPKDTGLAAITSFKPPPVHIDVSLTSGGGTAGVSGIF